MKTKLLFLILLCVFIIVVIGLTISVVTQVSAVKKAQDKTSTTFQASTGGKLTVNIISQNQTNTTNLSEVS